MGDDWDPFAIDEGPPLAAPTPAASPPAKVDSAATGPGDIEEEDDIFAALRRPPRVPRIWTEEEFGELLDKLFGIEDDGDVQALRVALKPVVVAVSDNGSLMHLLWLRALPIMMDLADAKPPTGRAQRPNLFGLLVDHNVGLLTKKDTDDGMSEMRVDGPPVSSSGAVIFIFGWGGATVDDLDDVASFYRDLFPGSLIARAQCGRPGSIGLRMMVGFLIQQALRAWASAAEQNSEAGRPRLLVHLFSNGGFFTWTEMLKDWEALSSLEEADPTLGQTVPPLSDVLRGVIYDSSPSCNIAVGPCVQSQVQGLAAMMHHIVASRHDGTEAGRKAAEVEARKCVQVLIGDHSPMKRHLLTKPVKLLTSQACDDGGTVVRLEPPVHLQFIYSMDDTIIEGTNVEDFIEKTKKRPTRKAVPKPRTLRFDKSRHCFHKIIHKEEYFDCVKLFSKGVLAD